MQSREVTFRIAELPDPSYARYKAAANGDVRGAIWRGIEHLLRAVASFPPGSVTTEIRFSYRPSEKRADDQERLRLYLTVRAGDEAIAEQISALIQRGPLSAFYEFQHLDESETLRDGLQAGCDVVRRTDLITPLYGPESNPNIPSQYFAIESFEANDKNDGLLLDQVLGNIDEPVDVTLRVEPVDVSHERTEHTRYLARLHSVNRETGREDEPSGIDYVGGEDSWRYGARTVLQPLRCRDPIADDMLRSHQRFHDTLRKPHLLFQIRVMAATPAVAQLVGSTMAESSFLNGSYALVPYAQGDDLHEKALQARHEAHVVALPICGALWKDTDHRAYDGLERLASVAPVGELIGAFRLPVASYSSPRCIRKNTDPPQEDLDDLIVVGYDEEPSGGGDRRGGHGLPRGIPMRCLTKHVSVFGTPGKGKTTAVENMLIQLSARGIPFIVIETAKAEYRALKALRNHAREDVRRLGESLEVYTIDADSPSPFRHNPLEIAPGISRDEHVGNLFACFQAAMPLWGPLTALVADSQERVYDDNTDPEHVPVVADLVDAAWSVLVEMDYVGEVDANLRAALRVRLESLTRRIIGSVLQCRKSAPTIEHLLRASSIIEIDALPPEEKCLFTLFLLTAIREHVKTMPKSDRGVRLAVVIEEAHNIVGRNTDARPSEDVADPRSHAAAYICCMLAEMRALGVAFVIADQSPSAVAQDVIQHTATKMAFGLVEDNNRAAVGGTMLFGETEFEEVARLRTGEAYFFTEGYHDPRRIRTVNLHDDMDLTPPEDDELLEYLREESWFRDTAELRLVTELGQLRGRMEAFDHTRLRLTKRFVELSVEHTKILTHIQGHDRHARLVSLAGEARALKRKLVTAHRTFVRGPYRTLRATESVLSIVPEAESVQAKHVRWFESVIEPGTLECINRINQLITRCANSTT